MAQRNVELAAYGAGEQRPEVVGGLALRRGVLDSVLDLVAVLVSGKVVLPNAHTSDFYVTGLGALVTIVYMGGLLINPARQVARMGIDSIMVSSFCAIGIFGLIALAGGGS